MCTAISSRHHGYTSINHLTLSPLHSPSTQLNQLPTMPSSSLAAIARAGKGLPASPRRGNKAMSPASSPSRHDGTLASASLLGSSGITGKRPDTSAASSAVPSPARKKNREMDVANVEATPEVTMMDAANWSPAQKNDLIGASRQKAMDILAALQQIDESVILQNGET